MSRIAMLGYLANLSTPITILWCYLLWWLFAVVSYFDANPRLWLSSLGISGIIGAALYLGTVHGRRQKTQLERWQVFRFFLMPFCVSSFAALIKDRGFFLVFHPTLLANARALALCLAFCCLVAATKWFHRRRPASLM